MFRVTTASLCSYCHRVRRLVPPSPPAASTLALPSRKAENQQTLESLFELSVDVPKVRRSKGWVLAENPAYVSETANLLRDMGADPAAIAAIFESHPEAFLCQPEEAAAQRQLWESFCSDKREMMSIIEKFPASFFSLSHRDNQRANVRYLQRLRVGQRTIGRLMAGAPQSLSRPVERNQEVIATLRDAYLDLGGDEGDLSAWLQELLGHNPQVLLGPAEAWRDILGFLRERGFSAQELLGLVRTLRGSAPLLSPALLWPAWAFLQEALDLSGAEMRRVVVRCPDLLLLDPLTLLARFQTLMDAGVSGEQLRESPGVLAMSSPLFLHRAHKMAACGHEVLAGGLDSLLGTNQDFEARCGRVRLRPQRPLVAVQSAED